MCRWCRTYFLKRGRFLPQVDNNSFRKNDAETLDETFLRVEMLYSKLWMGLREAVRCSFGVHSDVLDAGGEIQVHLIL